MTPAEKIAARLKAAREDAGLTQSQVADWLDVRRPSIPEIESGKRAVKSGELARLSSLYGRSLSWLLGRDSETEDRLAGALFRAGESTDPVLAREANLLRRRCRLLAKSERRMGAQSTRTLPQYPDDTALEDYSDAMRHGTEVAHQERQRMGFGLHAPLRDPWGIVEGAGLRVFPLRLGDQHPVDGIFAVTEDGHACAGVNTDKWVFRQVFSVIHEYAHALFDRATGSDICKHNRAWTAGHRTVYANRELRANQFAAAFLVPREALLRYLDGIRKLDRKGVAVGLTAVEVVRAQDHFGVSAEMLLWRLQHEHLVAGEQRRALKADLDAKGVLNIAKSLGYAWRDQAQLVTRAQETAKQAYALGHLSLGELAEILGLGKAQTLQRLSDWGVSQEFDEKDALVGAARSV